MRGRSMSALLAVSVIVAMPTVVLAQTHSGRTAWGDPDLQGIWTNTTTTPLERPEDLADRAVFTPEEFAVIPPLVNAPVVNPAGVNPGKPPS